MHLAGGTVANDIATGNGINASWLGNDADGATWAAQPSNVDLATFRTTSGGSNAAGLSNGVWDNNTNSRGAAIFQDDEYIEYTFDLTSATFGYDITGIDLYSNWGTGNGRNEINTIISYSLVASPTVFNQALISPAAYNPTHGTNTAGTQALMSITELTATNKLPGKQ